MSGWIIWPMVALGAINSFVLLLSAWRDIRQMRR